MNSSKGVMPALIASSVAMTIGVIVREVKWSSLFSQISSSPIVGGNHLSWSISPVLFVTGAIIGALYTGQAWRYFGNRLGMAFFDAILIIGLFAVTFPIVLTDFMVTGVSLVLGIGSGAMSAVIPTYVGEISHPKYRGRLGLMFPVIMAAGVVISDVFGPFQQYDHQQPFKISFNVFCYSIVILHVIGLCFIPKSPYSSPSNFFQHYYRNDDFSYIDYCGRFRRNLSWHIFDAFSCSVDRRALLISVGCMFFQQMCGINVMLPYMICIMKMAGIHVDPKTVFITLEIIQVITMSIAIIIIDYKGRRILLISSAVIMCLCLAGLEFCITIQMQLSVTTFSNLTMILITFFILAYSLGFGPVPWVIMGEIFSTKVKPYGISLTTAIHWLMVLAGIYFPYELTKFLEIDYFFLVYFVLCLFGALFAWWFVVETKQISLSRVQWEIDASLGIISYIPL